MDPEFCNLRHMPTLLPLGKFCFFIKPHTCTYLLHIDQVAETPTFPERLNVCSPTARLYASRPKRRDCPIWQILPEDQEPPDLTLHLR